MTTITELKSAKCPNCGAIHKNIPNWYCENCELLFSKITGIGYLDDRGLRHNDNLDNSSYITKSEADNYYNNIDDTANNLFNSMSVYEQNQLKLKACNYLFGNKNDQIIPPQIKDECAKIAYENLMDFKS